MLVEGDSDAIAVKTLAGRLGMPAPRVLETVFICDPDLESEFVRALGVDGVETVIAQQGELESFRRLQRQPFQRGRMPEPQLARFFGGRSGNKVRYARLLAEAVALDRIPPPPVSP